MPPKGTGTRSHGAGVCTVDGCDVLNFAREMCAMHYYRWLKYGDVQTTHRPRSRNGQATKAVWAGGRTIRLHIHIWEQHHGPVPTGYVVHHINHNHEDNRIENLTLMKRGDHSKHHRTQIQGCAVEGCQNTYPKHPMMFGYCRNHWRQLQKHGKILSVLPIPRNKRNSKSI